MSDTVGATVELVAYVLGEVFYEKYKARRFFFFSFALTIFGGIIVLINLEKESDHQKYLEMSFCWVTRFGISMIYEGVYMANGLFPILFASTSFGICNFFAGLSGLFSFEVLLKLDDENQFWVYLGVSFLGLIIGLFINEEEQF